MGEGLRPHRHEWVDIDVDKVYLDKRKNKIVKVVTHTCMICFLQRKETFYLPVRKGNRANGKGLR